MGYLDKYAGDYNDSEAAGGPTPAGKYITKCEEAEIRFTKRDDTPYLQLRCRVATGPRKGDGLFMKFWFEGEQIKWTKGAVAAIFGEAHDPRWIEANLDEWIGKGLELRVVDNDKNPQFPYVNFMGAAELPMSPSQASLDEALDNAMGPDGPDDDIPF